PLKYRQTVRSNEVGRINHAQLTIDVGKDHVEMDGGRLLRHHHNDEVRDLRLVEQNRGEAVDSRGTRSFAEADEQHVLTERMHIAAFECMVEAPLYRAVVDDPLVTELG